MARISKFELFSLDLPFKQTIKHAAAERASSHSIVLKCVMDSGRSGFGECLPRKYVTAETRDHAYELLRSRILPHLIGQDFSGIDELMSFLNRCNGKAPPEWVLPDTPQTAAWAAVDLALLDAFGHEFNKPVRLGNPGGSIPDFRYSIVFPSMEGFKAVKTLLKFRLYGFRQAKIKIDRNTAEDSVRLARRLLGRRCDIRVDANMTWDLPQAREGMMKLARYGISSFEQPLAVDDLHGLAALVRETGLGVMVDESLNDSDSLETLIAERACTAVNVRISKCGGLVASFNRCKRALEAGLSVQIGSQVGETSLLSAAQLILIQAVQPVSYTEGCFGLHVLQIDPVQPLLQFGYGGRPPELPSNPGIGVRINEDILKAWSHRISTIPST